MEIFWIKFDFKLIAFPFSLFFLFFFSAFLFYLVFFFFSIGLGCILLPFPFWYWMRLNTIIFYMISVRSTMYLLNPFTTLVLRRSITYYIQFPVELILLLFCIFFFLILAGILLVGLAAILSIVLYRLTDYMIDMNFISRISIFWFRI